MKNKTQSTQTDLSDNQINNENPKGCNYIEKYFRCNHQNFEVDKAKMYIDADKYSRSRQFNNIPKHQKKLDLKTITYTFDKYDRLILEFSGKTVSTPNYTGGITRMNINKLPEVIENETGIIVTTDTLLNSRVTAIDVKHDIILPNHIKPEHAISAIREMSFQSTRHRELISFDKNLGYQNSVKVPILNIEFNSSISKSTCKIKNDSLEAYYKYAEVITNKKQYPKFYESLDHEYLETIVKQMIRIERRIRQKRYLCPAFHIEHTKNVDVTLQRIFDCPYDVVGENAKVIYGF